MMSEVQFASGLRKAWKHLRATKVEMDRNGEAGWSRPLLACVLHMEQRLVKLEKQSARADRLRTALDECVSSSVDYAYARAERAIREDLTILAPDGSGDDVA